MLAPRMSSSRSSSCSFLSMSCQCGNYQARVERSWLQSSTTTIIAAAATTTAATPAATAASTANTAAATTTTATTVTTSAATTFCYYRHHHHRHHYSCCCSLLLLLLLSPLQTVERWHRESHKYPYLTSHDERNLSLWHGFRRQFTAM